MDKTKFYNILISIYKNLDKVDRNILRTQPHPKAKNNFVNVRFKKKSEVHAW